eukprot:CFRG2300T1
MGNRGMEDLIQVVNQLQDSFAALGRDVPIDLPQIAVVGGQSAGKSSVLENFVGKDFLPRGSGIVTRRPLILQLIHKNGQEYGEFLHKAGRVFTDFDDIRKEIEADTARITGANKGISNLPINLKVYSPHVLDLTLVDLPGLTKVAVGDQPHDIEIQIKNMIMEFITKPNCLILAVTPANSDLANSDALKLAKEVDPQGTRTIGVITKLDLMDEGTDAKDILENKLLPLRRGYVGVVNRSQKDIEGKKDIRAAQAAEKQFFRRHPAYSHLADKMGTQKLQSVLNQQLTDHIRSTIPELKGQLAGEVARLERDCAEFKHLGGTGKGASTKSMMSFMHQFSDDWWKSIDGSGDLVSLEELSGGAKINRIFFERFPYELNKFEIDERKLRREILFAIKNIHGMRTGLFTPDQAFEAICRKLIERMRAPSLLCVELSMQELITITSFASKRVEKYPRLRDELERIAIEQIKECHGKTNDQVEMLIECELAFMNTNHPDFTGGSGQGKTDEAKDRARKMRAAVNVGNQVIRKGFLNTPTGLGGSAKEYWFVLSSESLAWYKDEQEREQKYLLKLEGLKVRDAVGGLFGGKKNAFELFNPQQKFLFKDSKTLIMQGNGAEECESWKASFLRAGVFPSEGMDEEDEEGEGEKEEVSNSMDPAMERQVETIRNLVDSYMGIVGTTIKDLVPKTIMCFMIDSVKEYLKTDLVGGLYAAGNPDELMEESADETQRRDDMLRMLKMSKGALKLLSEISTSGGEIHIPKGAGGIDRDDGDRRSQTRERPRDVRQQGGRPTSRGGRELPSRPGGGGRPLPTPQGTSASRPSAGENRALPPRPGVAGATSSPRGREPVRKPGMPEKPNMPNRPGSSNAPPLPKVPSKPNMPARPNKP